MGHCAKKNSHASALQAYPLALSHGDREWVVGKSLASLGSISELGSPAGLREVFPPTSDSLVEWVSPALLLQKLAASCKLGLIPLADVGVSDLSM